MGEKKISLKSMGEKKSLKSFSLDEEDLTCVFVS